MEKVLDENEWRWWLAKLKRKSKSEPISKRHAEFCCAGCYWVYPTFLRRCEWSWGRQSGSKHRQRRDLPDWVRRRSDGSRYAVLVGRTWWNRSGLPSRRVSCNWPDCCRAARCRCRRNWAISGLSPGCGRILSSLWRTIERHHKPRPSTSGAENPCKSTSDGE